MALKGLNSLKTKLRRMDKDLRTKPRAAVWKQLALAQHDAKMHIIRQDAVASTELFRSIRRTRSDSSDGARLKLVSDSDHAAYVEFGTGQLGEGKFRAPDFSQSLVRDIREWMIDKPTFTLAPTWTRAFLIARSISNEFYEGRSRPTGTDSQPFMRPTWEAHGPVIKSEVRRAVRKSVRK